MRIRDWSSDVCSSDLCCGASPGAAHTQREGSGYEALHLLSRASTHSPGAHLELLLFGHTVHLGCKAVCDGVWGGWKGSSQERRVGKAGVSTCSSRWPPYH